MARVTLVNSIILGAMWFILTLWAGDDRILAEIERQILSFLWGGSDEKVRHKVNKNTIYLSKDKGGLGIINIRHQITALLGKLVWGEAPAADHPQGKNFENSPGRNGARITWQWIFNKCKTLPCGASNAMINLCKAWNTLKGLHYS